MRCPTMQKKRPDNLSMNSSNVIFPIIRDKAINSGQVHLDKKSKSISQRYGSEPMSIVVPPNHLHIMTGD